jgi:hypothetical protein
LNIVYTVCSSNHLPFAFSLGDSLKKSNPKYHFVIGLIDVLPPTIHSTEFQIIPVSNLNLPFFEELSEKYTIIELSCAMKPCFATYLFDANPEIQELIYLDADIWVKGDLSGIEESLKTNDIILTPHVTKPLPLSSLWNEKAFLNAGIYNAGFFAVKRTENTFRFLNWWTDRERVMGFYDFEKGMGVDQLWLNFVPIYFEKVLVTFEIGYNAAYWNLQERTVSKIKDNYFVNQTTPLIFYHFSGYSVDKPQLISKHLLSKKYLSDNQALGSLFNEYRANVLENNYEYYRQIKPTFGKFIERKQDSLPIKFIKKGLWKIINFIENVNLGYYYETN